MIDHALFLTGAQRSGTTLLATLLNQVPGVTILSQPFPLLFVSAKRSFLRSIGVNDIRYPLGHLFQETRYEPADLSDYLLSWRTSPIELAKIFDEMRDYSGQYTRFSTEQVDAALLAIGDDSDFASVIANLMRALSVRTESTWYGSKETTCEEFLPTLLQRGIRCILLIRDPRDIIASLNHGRGAEFGGSIKPTLFNLRSWRKSVAYALALQGQPGFRWCRYEDIVRNPEGEVGRLAEAIGAPFASLEVDGDLTQADGSLWRGNSSHTELIGISSSTIGASGRILEAQILRMIEAVCLPELRFLEYATTLTHREASETLLTMQEPYPSERRGLEGDAIDALNVQREVTRLERVLEPADSAESRRWFLFERTHQLLREKYRP